MSAGFTPGPWVIRKTANTNLTGAHWRELVANVDGNEVVLGEMFECDVGAADAEVNSAMVATAPDMFGVVLQYISDLRYPPTGDSIQRRIDRAEAVIAKARGETL